MIGAIIQARMGSSRLPGKVLLDLAGEIVLDRVIKRVQTSKLIDVVIVATTDSKQDDSISQFCQERGVTCFRGSEHDVLSRYRKCAEAHSISTLVRITADCPLVDGEVIDQTIELFKTKLVDYASNTVPPKSSRWPDGSDVEVFSIDALRLADEGADLQREREHVTFYFWDNPSADFNLAQLPNGPDWSGFRFTLDYPEDFDVLNTLCSRFKGSKEPNTAEIVQALQEDPDLSSGNQKYFFGIGWEQ